MNHTRLFDGRKFIPSNVGVYAVIYQDYNKLRTAFKYWDGKFWGQACNYPDAAYQYRIFRSLDQNSDWFGLKK